MSQVNASERIARAVQQRLLRAFHADLAIPPNRILVGFSGGADSLALALLLKRIARAIPSDIVLVHVDHRLRLDSGEDAEAARVLASSIGLPFLLKIVAGDARALHPGVGLEEAARRERYRLLAAECTSGDVVALAHHAQDQAETVLLHLIRGSGLRGAAGMARLTNFAVPWWNDSPDQMELSVWRPLLAERRDDIRAIPRAANLHPVEDPSNDDPGLRRNALRKHVIPPLESIDTSAVDAIARFAAIADLEDRYLVNVARRHLEQVNDGRGGIGAPELRVLDPAIRRRVVQRWLELAIGETPTLDRVDALIDLASTRDGTLVIEIANGLVAGIFGGILRCGSRENLDAQAWHDAEFGLPLTGSAAPIKVASNQVVVHNNLIERTLLIPRGDMTGEMHVRQLGNEWIEGFGMQSSDWLRIERVSPWIRARVQGIAIGERMWWIPRMSDHYNGDGRISVRWMTGENH